MLDVGTANPGVDGFKEAFQNRQFHLVYQPQVSLETGRVVGTEALLRWTSDEYGFVPPPDIISLAKECDQMIPLGEWILTESCRMNRKWNRGRRGEPLSMSVNVSPVQFLASDRFPGTVEAVLEETDLSPHTLTLEITEEAAVSDFERTREVFDELSDRGVSLALDDFGTGYSSLKYLYEIPFDQLKIDREFITDINTNQKKKRLVNAIIAMGRAMEMDVLAEGVDDMAQLEHIRGQRCHLYQGYLHSQPLTPEEIQRLIGKPA